MCKPFLKIFTLYCSKYGPLGCTAMGMSTTIGMGISISIYVQLMIGTRKLTWKERTISLIE